MNNSNYTFSFKFETQEKFSKLIQNLNCNKATQQCDIPIKILRENSEMFSYILCHNFNNSLFRKVFPSSLKKADVTPVYTHFFQNCIVDFEKNLMLNTPCFG